MRLPYLDQPIHLRWGEAAQLANAIEHVLLAYLEPGAKPSAVLVLTFGPLNRLRLRLLGRARQESYHHGPLPRKAWKLTLRYDDVAALRKILDQAPAAGGAWDEIYRASLNLDQYIDFSR